MRNIVIFIQPYIKTILISIFMGSIAGLGNAGLIALINHTLSDVGTLNGVMILMYLILLFIIFISESYSQSLFSNLSQGVICLLQTELCKKILSTPLSQIEKIGSGKCLTILTQDINTIGMTALVLPMIIINVVIIISCFFYLYLISLKIFLSILIFMLISFVIFMFLDKKYVKNCFEKARKLSDELYMGFQSALSGIKELKLNQRKRFHFFQDKIVLSAEQYRKNITSAMRHYALFQSGWKMNFFMLTGVVVFVLPNVGLMTGLSVANSVVVILFMISPLNYLISLLPNIRRALIAGRNIQCLYADLKGCVFSQLENEHIYQELKWQNIILSNITHTYQHEYLEMKFTLGPINLNISPGEVIMIAGHNGSGKSTLAKMIAGLYAPETGQIKINNMEINNHNIEWYRQLFSCVFSDFHLFDKLYGIDDSAIKNHANIYLKKLQLDKKISFNENVFSTLELSDGQKKRLSLLIAYLEDRSIFIFDEWASNQDPIFKEIFYTQLVPELKAANKAVIIITHDDKYLSIGDKIVTLENGKIISSTA